MPDDHLFSISPDTAAKRARAEYPNLAEHTRPTIDDNERAELYAAALRGEQRPLGVQPWRILPDRTAIAGIHRLACPGCGHLTAGSSLTAFACDSCGITRRVP